MKRSHIIATAALVLAVAGFATSRHFSDHSPDIVSGKEYQPTATVAERNNKESEKYDNQTAGLLSSGLEKSETPASTSMQVITSEQSIGHIGISEGKASDNPEDNLFEIELAENIAGNKRVWLAYDLYGISSGNGVSKSINDRPATGGYHAVVSKDWTTVREEISPSWLHKGTNRILFTAVEGMPAYSVRNLRIETEDGNDESISLAFMPVAYEGKTYIHGFTGKGFHTVKAGSEPLNLTDGEFEGMITASSGKVTITASKADGSIATRTFAVSDGGKADFSRKYTAYTSRPVAKLFNKETADSISISGGKLIVGKDVLLGDRRLSVNSLRDIDVPALDFGMTNVTAESEGYRFLPHGDHFAGEGATVKLKYDRTRIPSGYTEDDIRTYYFDTNTRHWVALERVEVDKESACVVSKTTHFTDMINGVIQAPESPETEGFAPTMMNDIKAADPTSKINVIAPPAANNRGTANLQYAFEMPPARNGMVPSLGIQYSSEGGSGWLGEGWNLPVPSITLDTRWGVPRYDTEKETETYLLSGAMLSTMDDDGNMSVSHRGDKMIRKADRQFYTRQGGDFSRIIRKGNSPADYYWEVTDRQGVKYTYGGNGAVLKGTITDINGVSRDVISEWKLARVEETHGDYIEYVYETTDEDVRGGLKAKAIYLKEVRAGNAGQEPHTVVEFEGNKVKQLKSNNARYGFLTSSNRLLEKVTVNFLGEELRSYAFTYKDGAFFKEVLESVKQFDSDNQEVAFQTFDYYDDVQSGNGYVPFQSSSETWNLHDDGLDAGFINPLQGTGRFSDKPTALGGTTGTSTNVSFYAGVGVIDGSPWKGNTVGGSYSHSTDNSKGLSTFVDLNGDGLPDKVYRQGGALYYRPQLRENDNGNTVYGSPIKINGISSFSTTKSSTNTGGAKATVGWMALTAEVGTDVVKTKTRTTEYFSDINGDGLIDLVSNGKVYFNHIEFDTEGNAIPTFTESSADTPSPIIYSGEIDASVITISPEEQEEAIASSPMQDIVRVWKAPKAGTVNISGAVKLISPTGDYDTDAYSKADGVRVAIQKGGTEYWNKAIAKGDVTAYEASVANLSVQKGDRIYFRVQSGNEETSNGAFDNVEWSPTITYSGAAEILPNGYSTTVYKPEEGAIYDVNTLTQLDGGPAFTLKGTFSKPITTDDVILSIIGSNDPKDANGNDNPNYIEKEIYTKSYAAAETADNAVLEANITNADKLTNFQFRITSMSNVEWTKIKWAPTITYTDTANVERTTSVPVNYNPFAEMISEGEVYTLSAEDTALVVVPRISLPTDFNGDITLTVKSADQLWGKKVFTVTNGIVETDSLKLGQIETEKVWFEFSYSGSMSNVAPEYSRVRLLRGLVTDSINAGFYAKSENEGFGMLYRGWGGFVYNASEGRFNKPIDESLLKLPESEDDKIDPLTMAFTPIGTDQTTIDRWVGQRQEIYLTAYEAGTARLGDQDVIITNPLENNVNIAGLSGECLQGTGAAAVTQVVSNKSNVVQSGALGITHNDANGNATTEVTMMDMNGDGYPDIVAGGTIQYTNTLGGLSGEKLGGIGTITTDNESDAWGYGGNPVASVSNIANTIKYGKNAMDMAMTSWQAQFSISGSAPKNTDEAVETFIDINGDGLPDKILSDKKVRLNYGYSFSDPIDWGLDRIQGGSSRSFDAGASGGTGGGIGGTYENTSINKASGSFMAGFGLVTSESAEEFNLMDINGDGLPDKVWKNEGSVTVALNTGNGFGEQMTWNGVTSLNESASTSESVNAAFTVSINIPIISIKISTNPGGSTGHSISRPRYALQDVDGDGYLDIVESDKESELKVTRSAIGRTNMLKSVVNSLGGTFTLDYEHTDPTYGLPGGKWVMSELTVDDGIHDDGPAMTTAFEYRNGRRDRHEREFLGFGEVITKNLDTEQGNALYRQAVEEYDVANYYVQGNLTNTSVQDAAGNKYTETKNEYDGYYLTANGDDYTFTAQSNLCSDRASAFVPLRYTSNLQYEGTADGMITSEAWNEYYLTGHHGELKSYKYSDKGTLGEDGNGSFDYQTAIQYTSNSAKNILGLPVNVTVTGGDGTVYHNVSATYNTNYPNHLTQITQQLGNGTAVTDNKYDAYGNITQKTLPENAEGQRMWYKYRYEPEMNMYVERVEDAFGYRSEAGNFDYRYGIALERRDLNNFYYETDIDNLGRITGVRGPNELATGVPYIIAFEYQPKATFNENGITAPAYAVTKHYDIQHPEDDIETVTFVDGFGRPVQVKKDGTVTDVANGSASSAENVMIVSGRNVYDAFGRVAKTYYPTTEPLGNKAAFNKSFDNVTPTITAYDVLDRAIKVTLPDDAVTETAYSLERSSHALVTSVKDALGNVQTTHTSGSGKTLKSIQKNVPDGDIVTTFGYDGIQRLVRVTDADGNVTTSTYDMGDRRTEVNHPASGKTTFTYDALGNVTSKQTANLAGEGKSITYDYDYNRLTGINYPDHPENNVKYYYGGRNASQNRIGRLMLREDGTGAIEYFYGKMGEVTKTRRTMIVPNQAIATYVTQWTYDSHNRLLEMIYPDEEKVTYTYDLGGQLTNVHGYKSYGYDYVNRIGYDKFGQRTYMKYCNGAETFYTYDPQRRRLQNLKVNAGGNTIMDNTYTYDAVSNVLSVANGAALPQSGKAGGQMSHNYTYDALYRLTSATGTYTGADSKTASYTLAMDYDNMHRITSKSQHLTQGNLQFDGTLNVGYELTYTYGQEDGKKFQLDNVRDVNYRTEATPDESQKTRNSHAYEYDANGNLVYVNTGRTKKDGTTDEKAHERKLKWDEENRLLASDDDGFVTNYWYDADGERTVKTSGESEQVYVNSEFAGGRTNTAKFSLYVSPYLVANQGGRYTKHIYIGSQRIVSKIGDFASYGSDPRRIQYAGSEADAISVDYAGKYSAQQEAIKENYATFDVPYNGTDNNDYVNGEGFCCDDGSMEAAQTRAMAKALEDNFQEGDAYENLQFYYHSDHLGSSSYITNLDGEVVQHIEYVPFGEVFIEERNNIWNTPYLFNAKEFDEETGLYYYGARYYDPRLSLWLSVDPYKENNPWITPYNYCSVNPTNKVDIDGNSDDDAIKFWQKGAYVDMSKASGNSTTIKGFPRNFEYFWNQMLKEHPEMFSKENVKLIQSKHAPIVDEQWIAHNKTHVNFKGNKLVHHHVEQGRFAVPIPEEVHRMYYSQLHGIKRGKYNANMRFLKGNVLFSSIGALLNITSLFIDSPNSPIYMFLKPGEGKQNRAYIDFETNQIYEWSLKNNNIREIRFYKDYRRIDGNWRGVELINKQYFDESGKPVSVN
ncbi:SpvB/TcaC N-terminal domain-containing protein [Bacteroides ovatus]|uniref:SpvB/TcaC N-terminal domain-containing protein n=1 Tax=Bacteroides ovatus TaxID=28116 RepID=UPI00189F3434|nr:SpvB/TcaC N-terminal domain-containing protein [Bacteroides ovatus]MDC2663187.1 SpvB/TcaC N-terminal domain-containing protein [Bacteroides ovatus]